jgi:hypothetical protein
MSLKFPLATSQLWDRSPRGSAIVVKYSDIFSFFILISKDIYRLLSSINDSLDQTDLFSASVVHVSELPDIYRRTLDRSIYKTTCKYAIFLNDSDLSRGKISIPLKIVEGTDSFSISEETEKLVTLFLVKLLLYSFLIDLSVKTFSSLLNSAEN